MNAASSWKSVLPEGVPNPIWIRPPEPAQHATDGMPAVAGIVPFSSVDWPGQLAATVFIGGCPWRCTYCHNPHLQARQAVYDWAEVRRFLTHRQGLIDGVVFSGGEPLSEVRLPAMVADVKALGFKVALHTAGIYPARLAKVLPTLDWVGFDVKTDAVRHTALTGRAGSHLPAEVSLEMLLASSCAFECRTTWSPRWLAENDLLRLAENLARRGVRQYAVQHYRARPGGPPDAVLSELARRSLADWFAVFETR